MPRDGWTFRNGGSISQLWNERGGGLRRGTHVPMSGLIAAKPAAKWGLGCEIGSFKALGSLQRITQLWNGSGGGMGCEIISQPTLDFAAALFGCEIILQQKANFVGASLGLRNLADLWIFLAPELLFASWDLPSLLLQFLLNYIIQKD